MNVEVTVEFERFPPNLLGQTRLAFMPMRLLGSSSKVNSNYVMRLS